MGCDMKRKFSFKSLFISVLVAVLSVCCVVVVSTFNGKDAKAETVSSVTIDTWSLYGSSTVTYQMYIKVRSTL